MSTTEVKIVIDTNIFITILGRKSPNRWIFDRILSGEFILCISNDILFEYEEILTQKTISVVAKNVLGFLLLSPHVNRTEIFYNWNLIKEDPDDNKFVDCAVSSAAYCIVSNDKHFNSLKKNDFPKVKVLNLTKFENEFQSR
jgi:putative PIN family toxin of toxin-antitoxin system